MSLILQAVLGGVAKEFRVSHQSEWMFRFSVASKKVGLMVHHLSKFACKSFAIFFTLWRDGAPDYVRELKKWNHEQDLEWSPPHHLKTKFKKSYASVVMQPTHSSGRKSVFKRISYPSTYFASNFLSVSGAKQVRQSWVRKSAPDPAPISQGRKSRDFSNISCFRCLALGHVVSTCTQQIRCKRCYRYGHIERFCWAAKSSVSVYRAKPPILGRTIQTPDLNASPRPADEPPSPSPAPSPSNQPTVNPTSATPPPSSLAMFSINPTPHAPRGFEVVPHDAADPPLVLSAYLGCMEAYNEDLAIAYLLPEVNKEDFPIMAEALKNFFACSYGVHLVEVQPCSIGDAFVRFHSPVERERFLDQIIQFGPHYQLQFGKHDEGKNARFQDMDREAWVMIMSFPADARNNSSISKAVAGFGLLRYWHDTNNEARIVAKINLSENAKIPHAVLVSAGLPPKTRSWMCPVFVLKHKNVTMLGDEGVIPSNGPLFPLPLQAPRWLGFNGPMPDNVQGDNSSVGQDHGMNGMNEMNVDGINEYAAYGLENQNQNQYNDEPDANQGLDLNVAAGGDLHNDAEGGMSHMSGAAADFAASDHNPSPLDLVPLELEKPDQVMIKVKNHMSSLSFHFHIPVAVSNHVCTYLSSFCMDLDTIVPSYIADEWALSFLAKSCFEQYDAPVVFGPAKPLVPYSDDEDEEVVVLDEPVVTPGPRKRRSRKLKEPLDERFLRRSKRCNASLQGFKDAGAMIEASKFPDIYSGKAVLPEGEGPAPYLSTEVLHGIGAGFLQIQPSVVSAALLTDLDDDNEDPTM